MPSRNPCEKCVLGLNMDYEKIDSDSLLNMPFLKFEDDQKIPFYVWNYDLTKNGWDWRLPPRAIGNLRMSRFRNVPLISIVALFGCGSVAGLFFGLMQFFRGEVRVAPQLMWQFFGLYLFWMLLAVAALWVLLRTVKKLLEPVVCSLAINSEGGEIELDGLKRFWSFRPQPMGSIMIRDVLNVNLHKNGAAEEEFALWLELKSGKRIYLSVYDMKKEEASFLKMLLEREFKASESRF